MARGHRRLGVDIAEILRREARAARRQERLESLVARAHTSPGGEASVYPQHLGFSMKPVGQAGRVLDVRLVADGVLVYERAMAEDGSMGEVTSRTVRPTEEQWKDFGSRVRRAGACRWDLDHRTGATQGTNWRFSFTEGRTRIQSAGERAEPVGFDEVVAAIDDLIR